MLITSARDNKNNRWKKKRKTNIEKKNGVAQTIVKVWELHDFVVRLSKVYSD